MPEDPRPKPDVVIVSTSSVRGDRPRRLGGDDGGATGRYKPRHPFLAGAVTGGIEILLTYPLEYTKCQLQLHPESAAVAKSAKLSSTPATMIRKTRIEHREFRTSSLGSTAWRASTNRFHTFHRRPLSSVPHAATMFGVLRETIAMRGFAGLYRGLSSWLFFSFPRAAFRFTTYEACLTAYEKYQTQIDNNNSKPAKPPTIVAFMAGTIAGAVEAATCMTPMHCIQIKMQQDADRARPRFKGFFHASAAIVRDEGLPRGLLSGMGPTVTKAAINNCIRFGLMSELSGMRRRQKGLPDAASLGALDTLALGGVAGALSAVATHPIDTVKSNLQGNSQHKARFGGTSVGCVRWLLATAGPRGLFQGLSARMVRVTLEVSLHFTLFDLFSRALDSLL